MALAGDGKAPKIQGVLLLLCLAGAVVPGVAAQLGFDAGHQLQGIKGLGDVIIRPQSKAGDFIHIFHPGCKHDNGIKVPLPDTLAKGEAVHIRQHHIQHRQGGLLPQGVLQGRKGGIKFGCLKPLAAQVQLHQIGNLLLVIHNDDFLFHLSHLFPAFFQSSSRRAGGPRPLLLIIALWVAKHKPRGAITSLPEAGTQGVLFPLRFSDKILTEATLTFQRAKTIAWSLG